MGKKKDAHLLLNPLSLAKIFMYLNICEERWGKLAIASEKCVNGGKAGRQPVKSPRLLLDSKYPINQNIRWCTALWG